MTPPALTDEQLRQLIDTFYERVREEELALFYRPPTTAELARDRHPRPRAEYLGWNRFETIDQAGDPGRT